MLQDSEYKSRATIAVNKLIMMLSTYIAETCFSALDDIKNKKRKKLKMVEKELMCGALDVQIFSSI